MPSNPFSNYQLTKADIDTIISALELVPLFPCTGPQQTRINTFHSSNVVRKLVIGDFNFAPDEIRVITLALDCALSSITGTGYGIDNLPSDLATELKSHFFVLNNLYPRFQALCPHI